MKNYREKIYKSYSSNSGKNLAPITKDELERRKPFLQNIINNYFPKNKDIKILEIGCGFGEFAHFIQESGYNNYIGIDGSEEQIKEAARLNIKNVLLRDLVKYLKELESESLDLLIAIDVIEHFTKEELFELIDDMERVMKIGGLIVTHQPNAESPFGGGIRYGDFTHELAFTTTSMSQIFLASGFDSVESFEDSPISHGLKSIIRKFLWETLVKPLYKFLIIVESGGVDSKSVFTKNFLTIIKK